MSSEVVAELETVVSPIKNVEEKEITDKSPQKRKLEEEDDVIEAKKVRQEENSTEIEAASEEPTEEKADEKVEEAATEKVEGKVEEVTTEKAEDKVEEATTEKVEEKAEEAKKEVDERRQRFIDAFSGLLSKVKLPESSCPVTLAGELEKKIYAANNDSNSEQYLTAGLTLAYRLFCEDFVGKVAESTEFDLAFELPEKVKESVATQVKNELAEASIPFDIESLRIE